VSGRNARATGAHPASTRMVAQVADPQGNRAARRAAAKVARMRPQDRERLRTTLDPLVLVLPPKVMRARGVNGK
jgi:hypothetical protein